MRVRDPPSVAGAGDGVVVALRHGRLLDGPLDGGSGGTLGKARPDVCPACVGGKLRRGDGHVVREERERHAGGTDAVLVVGVVPLLRRRHGDVGGDVRVRDRPVVVPVRGGGGVFRGEVGILRHGPGNELSGGVRGQIGPSSLPAEVGGHIGSGHGDAIRQKRQRHRAGADAVLVVGVVPHLRRRHGDVGGDVRVRDPPGVAGAGDGVVVALRHGRLLDGPLDGGSGGTLGKARPDVGPAIVGGELRRGDGHVVRKKGEGHLVGADTVLVVGVVPALRRRDGDDVGRVRVGDGEGKAVREDVGRAGRRVVIGNDGLANVIDDVRGDVVEANELRKVFPCLRERVPGGVEGINLLAVGVEGERHGVRADVVLVTGIVPDLGGGNGDALNLVGVGDGPDIVHVPPRICVVLGHGVLLDGVDDVRAGGALDEVGPRRRPARGLGNDGVGRPHAARVQRERHFVGTEAFAVIVVIPDLGRGDVDGVELVRVDDGEVVDAVRHDGGGVALRNVGVGLDDPVGDGRSGGVLGQPLPRNGPAALFGDLGGGDGHRVRRKREGHGCGTPAIRVVAVLPALRRRDGDDIGRVRVGDGEVIESVGDDGGGVALRNGILADAVGDGRPGIALGKIRPGVCPAIVGGDHHSGDGHVV